MIFGFYMICFIHGANFSRTNARYRACCFSQAAFICHFIQTYLLTLSVKMFSIPLCHGGTGSSTGDSPPINQAADWSIYRWLKLSDDVIGISVHIHQWKTPNRWSQSQASGPVCPFLTLWVNWAELERSYKHKIFPDLTKCHSAQSTLSIYFYNHPTIKPFVPWIRGLKDSKSFFICCTTLIFCNVTLAVRVISLTLW